MDARGEGTDFADLRRSTALAPCPIGDPWSRLVERDAPRGFRRTGAFQGGRELAKNVPSDRLRELVAPGMLAGEPTTEGGGRDDTANSCPSCSTGVASEPAQSA